MTTVDMDAAHTHYRGLLARMEDARTATIEPPLLCVRCKRLTAEFGELCEPCWEIGRDEPPEDYDPDEAER